MRRPLYLDTARLGLPEQEVLRSLSDLASFIACEGLSPRFEDLLWAGYDAFSSAERRRFRGLSHWYGVDDLRKDVSRLIGAPPSSAILLASRTSQLMRFAARLLASRSTRVLTTDLEWPGFVRILEVELARVGALVSVPASELAFEPGSSAKDLAQHLAASFRDLTCDALFLSSVSHLGIRLPVAELLENLGCRHRPGVIVIDGSQAIGHLPYPLRDAAADVFISGSHKWLRAYRPLGIAVISDAVVIRSQRESTSQSRFGGLDDPLIAFLDAVECGSRDRYGETVDLSPLFSAGAASSRALGLGSHLGRFSSLCGTAELVSDALEGTGWKSLRPDGPLRTGILLARSPDGEPSSVPPLSRRFRELGVVLTSYPGGIVRMSMPEQLGHRDIDCLRKALRRVTRGGGRLVSGWREEFQLVGVPELRPVSPLAKEPAII